MFLLVSRINDCKFKCILKAASRLKHDFVYIHSLKYHLQRRQLRDFVALTVPQRKSNFFCLLIYFHVILNYAFMVSFNFKSLSAGLKVSIVKFSKHLICLLVCHFNCFKQQQNFCLIVKKNLPCFHILQ